MNNDRRFFIRTVATGLVLCFGAAECVPAWALSPVAMPIPNLRVIPSDPAQIEIPFEHVTLKEFYKGSSDKLVIHVQDAHSNLSGQESLAGALDHLMRRYDMPLVLVEGADRDVTLTDVRKKLPAETWKIAAKRFLFDGAISGEEYLNLTSDHPMKIIGVEHRYLYDENLKAYAKLAEKRADIVAYLRQIRVSIDRLKNRLYPRALVAYERFKSGPLEGRDYNEEWKRLDKLASSLGLVVPPEFTELVGLRAVRGLEEKMDFDRANADQARIFKRLTDAGISLERFVQPRERIKNIQASQHLITKAVMAEATKAGIGLEEFVDYAAYARYLEAFAALRLDKLTDEMEVFEESVYAALLKDADARRMRAVDRFVGLLESAYNIRMTSKQFESYTKNAPGFATPAWQAFVNEKLIGLGYYDGIVPYRPLLEEARPALEEFYRLVHQRDFAFIENTLRIMEVEKQKAAFLIVGGYHTAHLTQLLREKEISYAVLTPVVTFETDRNQYEKMLLTPIDVAAQKRAKAEDGRAKKSGIRKLGARIAPEQIFIPYLDNASVAPGARALLEAGRLERVEINEAMDGLADAEKITHAPGARTELPSADRQIFKGWVDLDVKVESLAWEYPQSSRALFEAVDIMRDANSSSDLARHWALLQVMGRLSGAIKTHNDNAEAAQQVTELLLKTVQLALYLDITLSLDGKLRQDLRLDENPEYRAALEVLVAIERALPKDSASAVTRADLIPDFGDEPRSSLARLLLFPAGTNYAEAEPGDFLQREYDKKIGEQLEQTFQRITSPKLAPRIQTARERLLIYRKTLLQRGNIAIIESALSKIHAAVDGKRDRNLFRISHNLVPKVQDSLNFILGNFESDGVERIISLMVYADELKKMKLGIEVMRGNVARSGLEDSEKEALDVQLKRADDAILYMAAPGARSGLRTPNIWSRFLVALRRASRPDYRTLSKEEVLSRLRAAIGHEVAIYHEVKTPVGLRPADRPLEGTLIAVKQIRGGIQVKVNVTEQISQVTKTFWPGRRNRIGIIDIERPKSAKADPDATRDYIVSTRDIALNILHNKLSESDGYKQVMLSGEAEELNRVSGDARITYIESLTPGQIDEVIAYDSARRKSSVHKKHTFVPNWLVGGFVEYFAIRHPREAMLLDFYMDDEIHQLMRFDRAFGQALRAGVDAFWYARQGGYNAEAFEAFVEWLISSDDLAAAAVRPAANAIFDRLEALFGEGRGYLKYFDKVFLRKNIYEALIFDKSKEDARSAMRRRYGVESGESIALFNIATRVFADLGVTRDRGFVKTFWRLLALEIRTFGLGIWAFDRDVASQARQAVRRLRGLVRAWRSGDEAVMLEAHFRTMTLEEALPVLFESLGGSPVRARRSSRSLAAMHILKDVGMSPLIGALKVHASIRAASPNDPSVLNLLRQKAIAHTSRLDIDGSDPSSNIVGARVPDDEPETVLLTSEPERRDATEPDKPAPWQPEEEPVEPGAVPAGQRLDIFEFDLPKAAFFLDEPPVVFVPKELLVVRADEGLLNLAASRARSGEFFAGIRGASTYARFRKTAATLEVAVSGGRTVFVGKFVPAFDAATVQGRRVSATGTSDTDVLDLLLNRAMMGIAPDVQRIQNNLLKRLEEGRAAGGILLWLDDWAADPDLGDKDPAFQAAIAQAKPLADMFSRLGFRIQIAGTQKFLNYAVSEGKMGAYLSDIGDIQAAVVGNKTTLSKNATGTNRKPLPIERPRASQNEFDILDLPGTFYQAAELSMMRPGEEPPSELVSYTGKKKGLFRSEWTGIRSSFRKLAEGDVGSETLDEALRLIALPKLFSARITDIVDLLQRVARAISSAA